MRLERSFGALLQCSECCDAGSPVLQCSGLTGQCGGRDDDVDRMNHEPRVYYKLAYS